jgi:sulfate/thiosulfate transport system substrate-binding protein
MAMRWICIALVGAALLAGTATGASNGGSVNLVAYSTPKDAYGKIIQAFNKTKAGSGASFNQSYGASGDQARAVAAGQPADLVALSLDPDVNLLVKKRLVPKNWAANSHRGIVSDSVVVFVVRDGNPKKIKGWGDLVKPGIEVITPNPFTSGGARWNVMAAYGAQRRAGKTDKQAIAYLFKLFKHVPVQPDSARAALAIFAQGKGDVLLTYENEAKYAEKKGVHTEYHTPKATMLIETPVALTKTGLAKPAAKAFYKYLWSSTGQKAFASQGYRPVVKSVAKGYKFYKPAGLFTINSKKLGLNGWTKVNNRFFHPEKGVMAKIERSIGH